MVKRTIHSLGFGVPVESADNILAVVVTLVTSTFSTSGTLVDSCVFKIQKDNFW